MSVKKNLIFNMIYQALNMLLPLITAPYLARVIGARGTGVFSYYYSIAGYFVLFGMLGVNNYGNRSIAVVRDNPKKMAQTFWEIYSVQAIASAIIAIIYIFFSMSIRSEERLAACLNFFYVISALFDINWFFFGIEAFKWTSIRSCLIKIISVIAILLLVKQRDDLYIYIFIMAISILISQLILWPKAIKLVPFYCPSFYGIKRHIKPILILFIPVIAISLYKIMDKVMLGMISSRIQSGLYENAEKIINLPIVFVNALGTVMLPKMSNLVAKGEYEKSKTYIRDSMQFIMGLAVPVALGTAAISKVFAPVFFGEEFRDCAILIKYLSVITIFNSWANVIRTQYLIPNEKDKEYIISVISGAIVNLVFNSLLIVRIGALGAVIGTIFAEFTVAFIQTIMVRKRLEISKYFRDSCIFFISGILMYYCVINIGDYCGESIFTLIVQILIGIILYGTVTLVLFYIFKRERLMYFLKSIKK